MKHELWQEPDGEQTFCLSGPRGNDARALLHPDAKLIWEIDAASHFEAMSKYYAYMGWGEYQTDFSEQDRTPYSTLGWE